MKKKLKQIFSLALTAALVLNLFTFSPVEAAVTENGAYYGFNSDFSLPEVDKMYQWSDYKLGDSGMTVFYHGNFDYLGICDVSADDPENKAEGDYALKAITSAKKQERRVKVTVPVNQKLEKGDIYTFSWEFYAEKGNANYGKSVQANFSFESGETSGSRGKLTMADGREFIGGASIRDFGRGNAYYLNNDLNDYTMHQKSFVRYEVVFDTQDEEWGGEQTVAVYTRHSAYKAAKQVMKGYYKQVDDKNQPVSETLSKIKQATVEFVVSDNGATENDVFAFDNFSSSVYHDGAGRKNAVYMSAEKDKCSVVTFNDTKDGAGSAAVSSAENGDEIAFTVPDGETVVAYRSWADESGAATANLSTVPEDATVLFDVDIPESADLANYYVVLAEKPDAYCANKASAAIALPLSDYCTESGSQRVKVPFADFKTKGERIANSGKPVTDTNLFYTAGLGIACKNGDGAITLGNAYIAGKVAAPTNLNVSGMNSGEINLAWTASANNVAAYELYRDDEFVAEIDGNTTSYSDKNLEENKYYNYSLRAKSLCGEYSDYAKLDNVYMSVLGVPSTFTLSNTGGDKLEVVLNWGAAIYGEPAKFKIYRDGEFMADVPSDTFTYSDTTVEANKSYTYEIASSTEDDVTSLKLTESILAAYAYAPLNLAYANETLTWEESDFADVYNIYVNGNLAKTSTQNTTTASDILGYNDIYTIEVSAVTAEENESLHSKSIRVYNLDPDMEKKFIFFEDGPADGYKVESLGVNYDAEYSENTAIGTKSVKLTYDPVSRGTFTFGNIQGLGKNALNSTDRVMIGVYVPEDVDADAFTAGISYVPAGNNATRAVFAVSLGDYIKEKGRWTVAEIPISDLPQRAQYKVSNQIRNTTLDLNQVTGISIIGDFLNTDNAGSILLDEVFIAKYSQKSAAIAAPDGNVLTGDAKLDTNAEYFALNTGNGTVPAGATVEITDGEGAKIAAYAVGEGNAVRVYPLEALKANTTYTVTYAGFANELGAPVGGTAQFTTNDAAPEAKSASIANAFEITANDARVGGAVNAEVKLKKITVSGETEAAVALEISYPSNFTASKDDVTVSDTVTDAKVTVADGKITISGKVALPIAEDGTFAKVKFGTVRSGKTPIKVSGKLTGANSETALDEVSKEVNVDAGAGAIGGGTNSNGTASSPSGSYGGGRPSSSGGSVSGTVVQNKMFADVPVTHWAYSYIKKLADEKIITGYDDNTFRPEQSVTREEFVVMADRAVKLSSGEAELFTDTDANAWYAQSLIKAVAKGVVAGREDGSFGIGESITRQDMCVILVRLAAAKEITLPATYDYIDFADSAEISDYAAEAVKTLKKAGVINGDENGNFNPLAPVTRAAAAKVLSVLKAL